MGVQLNEDRYGLFQVVIDPPSVAAGTSVEVTATVRGLRTGDYVRMSKPTVTAGILVGTSRVSAADTVAVTIANVSTSAVDAASETYTGYWFRPEKTPSVGTIQV